MEITALFPHGSNVNGEIYPLVTDWRQDVHELSAPSSADGTSKMVKSKTEIHAGIIFHAWAILTHNSFSGVGTDITLISRLALSSDKPISK